MKDTKVTVASLKSLLIDPSANLERVKGTCAIAARDGARMVLCPELMLTGHGAHPKMEENAEPVPGGPLCQEILALSKQHDLCICVGIAEQDRNIIYNSQIVVDRGKYLGLQRKINLSNDEYVSFGMGEQLEVFDIGDIRFGIIICYDNRFPELALGLAFRHVDVILSPHAARCGVWPDPMTPKFVAQNIKEQQYVWEKVHRARASDHNAYVLLCNAVGSSTDGLDALNQYKPTAPVCADPRKCIANHAGTIMGLDPDGEVFLRSSVTNKFAEEIVTVELKAAKRNINYGPSRNRRLNTVLRLLENSRST